MFRCVHFFLCLIAVGNTTWQAEQQQDVWQVQMGTFGFASSADDYTTSCQSDAFNQDVQLLPCCHMTCMPRDCSPVKSGDQTYHAKGPELHRWYPSGRARVARC
jgi:hypothetical protein